MSDLIKRLRQTPLYEGSGGASDLPNQAANRIEALEEILKTVRAQLAAIISEAEIKK